MFADCVLYDSDERKSRELTLLIVNLLTRKWAKEVYIHYSN